MYDNLILDKAKSEEENTHIVESLIVMTDKCIENDKDYSPISIFIVVDLNFDRAKMMLVEVADALTSKYIDEMVDSLDKGGRFFIDMPEHYMSKLYDNLEILRDKLISKFYEVEEFSKLTHEQRDERY